MIFDNCDDFFFVNKNADRESYILKDLTVKHCQWYRKNWNPACSESSINLQ